MKGTARRNEPREIYIIRAYETSAVKTGILDTMLKLCTLTTDMKVERLGHVIRITNLGKPGDPRWMDDNVFRYEDLHVAQSNDTADTRAERIAGIYRDMLNNEEPNDRGRIEPKMGYMVLIGVLDRNYIPYDVSMD